MPEIAVLMLSAAIFFYKFGWRLLDVTNIGWIFRIGFDNATEFISWEYYRAAPWSFPVIGTFSGYDYPTVTGVGLTGAIPLLAIPLKILSPILPAEFQHFGWWFLACYILQGWFALKLLKAFKPQCPPVGLVLAALFFVIAPPLLFRAAHMNLSAHFLILASFYLYFQPFTSREKFKYSLILIIATAMIHQYLTVMLLGLAFATSNDLWQRKKLSFIQLIGFNLAHLTAVLMVFYLIGNFNIPNDATQSVGFGNFSANLNTFFNSFNYTRFQSALKTSSEGQYEGIAYFGVGIFLHFSGLLALVGSIFLPLVVILGPVLQRWAGWRRDGHRTDGRTGFDFFRFRLGGAWGRRGVGVLDPAVLIHPFIYLCGDGRGRQQDGDGGE